MCNSISALTITVATSRKTKIKNWKKGIYCLSLSGRGDGRQLPVPAAGVFLLNVLCLREISALE